MRHKTGLQEWRALSHLTFEELQARLVMRPEHLDSHTSYGNLAHVVELHNKSADPARFYFREAKAKEKPIAVVIEDHAALAALDPKDLRAELGAPREMLASRAGKEYTHFVYPERGIAFSANRDEVVLLEIFPPTTLAHYKQELYLDPGPFVK